MENEKLDAVLKSFAALVVPHIIAHPDVQKALSNASVRINREQVEEIIQTKIDDLGKIDQDMIAEVVRSELNEMELVDEDRARELAREEMDDIDLTCNGGFEDSVERIVRGMSFSVEVS